MKDLEQFGKLARIDNKFEDSFKIFHGTLFHRNRSENSGWKLCVPSSMVQNVVIAVHCDLGHFGSTKCIRALQEGYYFTNLSKVVKKIVSSCDICQRTKASITLRGQYQAILPNGIGELVATDLYGPLPTGVGGARYLLVLLDVFSKLVMVHTNQ